VIPNEITPTDSAATVPPDPLAAFLAPGETILWRAQPKPYVFMLRGLPNIAYGVTWSVLGAFWYHGSGGIGKYSAFEGWWKLTPLFSIPFILAGFSFFLYPIRLGARARRTWYVITNHHAFTVELFQDKPVQLHVFSPENLAALDIFPRLGGLSDLVFSNRYRTNQLQPRLEHGFFGVENGSHVAELIRALSPPTAPA
jgi:hypothetical protein